MPYPFEQILAADPSNPDIVASNGLVTLYAPGDASKTPIALTTLFGAPLANPVRVNGLGFGPAFISALAEVAWSASASTGELGGLFTSTAGLKADAENSRKAAEAAAAIAEDIQRRIQNGELGGNVGPGGAPNNGSYWNREQTVPVVTIASNAPWPTSAPEGALVVRLTGTGV